MGYGSEASCRCELGADRGTAPPRSGGDGDSCRPGRRFCLPPGEFGRPLAWCTRRVGQDGQRSTRRKIDEFCRGPDGTRFGEGSLLKSEPRRCDGIALRDSSIAFMPRNTFALLLDSASPSEVSFGFSSSERLGDFFSMVKYERSLAPNASLAKRVGGAVQFGAVSG